MCDGTNLGPLGKPLHPCCGTDGPHRADCWTLDPSRLPWHRPFRERRCRAHTGTHSPYAGRCDLAASHPPYCDHALERGFDTPRWSTRWTA